MKDSSRTLIAIFIIFWGVSLILNQFSIGFLGIDFGNFWGTFWPIILIFIGVLLLNNNQNKIPGIVLVGLGIIFQISELTKVDVWSIFFPLILIGAGFLVLGGQKLKLNSNEPEEKKEYIVKSNLDEIKETIIFWGLDKKVGSENFKGGEITCVFGGAELDLRETKITKAGGQLFVNCVFGGVEIRVPETIKVEVQGTPFLGGLETNFKTATEGPVLKIVINVAFGGVEIKN